MNKYILRYRQLILLFTTILVIYASGLASGIFTIPKLKTGDLFFNLRYRFSPRPKGLKDIVIVGIDDSAYYSYGKKWPWKRNIFASLVYKLKKGDPKVIGVNLVFMGKSAVAPANDLLLSEAFRDAGNVILASYFDKEGKYIIPYKDFRESVLGYGFTNKPEDIDTVIRDAKLFEFHTLKEEIVDYSFDLKIVSVFKGGLLKDIKLWEEGVSKNGILALNYSAKMSDFIVIPFKDVIDDKISPDAFSNKIVLVGTTGEVFHDINFTPLGEMPSVGVVANTILMLLNKNFIYKVPIAIDILLTIILGFIFNVVTFKRGIVYKSIFLVGFLTGFVVISLILIINNISWDFFSIPAVILTIYLSSSSINYINLLVQSIKIRKLVMFDVLTGLPTRRYFLFKLESALKNIRRGEKLSLVLFSIDNPQVIVSEIGPEKANRVIKEVGEVVSKFSRKTRGIDFVSRYSEVEFCCILRRTPEKGALAYANRIKRIINNRVKLAKSLTISAGVADANVLADKYGKLFVKCAEAALSRCRKEGVGRICIYNPQIDKIPVIELGEAKEISEVDLSYVAEELQEKYKEMAILINKLRHAQEDVIKSERLSAVWKVAATIHHDLSKPIANLEGILEIVKKDLDKASLPELGVAKGYISSAIGEIRRIEELASGFKDLYRPKEREVLPININKIIEEMIDLLSGKIIEYSIKINKRLDSNLPRVLGDSGELKQVFLNLFHNAIDSMPRGGMLEIDSSVPKDKEDMVEVKVTDTGCGIPQENLEKIFDAFFTTKKEEGAGLGLYASLEILKKYGGTIKVESVVNKGSAFTVYLPHQPKE